ncbi:GNAT family N-acetyltransferase [Dickeya dianthicola]|uniref:GNAT family N-acetyltransferase n=1 Tax=Dickeya dianthicola TaxID=204039 RepID=UPI00136BD276|nr:GNAT family N-acetyltransferase [Dickeya dianthicola]MCI4187218.1 GNAT family N-acetyltransferase [Dickeya dianthicola]MCI4239042.1 GNAT family N-acetyltransferase [Dickeya dianthicola]MCI4257208.1 GNAT family N-acetyltransferase [Dickeya dianthicola]MZG24046.1 GNAT family N-acetyltransferase [Dickeya dianthicola]MZI90421.1 GNAT family N-acetyltransferase [Dickeya dianthicola]
MTSSSSSMADNVITYKVNDPINVDQFIHLLNRTSLGPRRPLDQRDTLAGMLTETDLLVTAWRGDELVGVARSVTDYHFCCYLSDLAVDETCQHGGIGRRLIAHTAQQLKPQCRLILIAAPQAVDYYPNIGFEAHPSAWHILAGDFLALKR